MSEIHTGLRSRVLIEKEKSLKDELIGRLIVIDLMMVQAMVREARRYIDPDDYIRREFEQMIEAIKTAPLKIEDADTETCRAIALAHLGALPCPFPSAVTVSTQ